MKVLGFKEMPDGSAEVKLDLEEDELQILLSKAVNDILREYINKLNKDDDIIEGEI